MLPLVTKYGNSSQGEQIPPLIRSIVPVTFLRRFTRSICGVTLKPHAVWTHIAGPGAFAPLLPFAGQAPLGMKAVVCSMTLCRQHGLAAIAVSLLLCIGSPGAHACPYSIRDAGFIVRETKPYQLVFLTQNAQIPQYEELLADALASGARAEQLRHANLSAEVLGTERDAGHDAVKALLQSPTEAVRQGRAVSALLSPNGKLLAQAPVGKTEAKNPLADVLAACLDSEARRQIVRGIIKNWCVLLVVTGDDPRQNAQVREAVQSAARSMVGFQPEMGDKIRKAPPVVTLSRAQAKVKEATLLQSLGLSEEGATKAQVAVLFGRLRRLGPILNGAQISEPTLRKAMRLLGRNCTCTADPASILGPSAPIVWDADRQAETVEALGFDPDSPIAISGLSGVWTEFNTDGQQREPGEYLPDPGGGYVEFTIEPDGPAEEQDAEPAQDPDQVGQRRDEDQTWQGRGMQAVIGVTAGLAAIAVGGSAILVLRRRRGV